MIRKPHRIALAGGALLLPTLMAPVATGATTASARVAAVSRMPCSAQVSNPRPPQYSTIYVLVASWGSAAVTTKAEYKTTTTEKRAVTDRRTGRASIAYRISDATVGYPVKVLVTVSKGTHHGSCLTSFTPRKR